MTKDTEFFWKVSQTESSRWTFCNIAEANFCIYSKQCCCCIQWLFPTTFTNYLTAWNTARSEFNLPAPLLPEAAGVTLSRQINRRVLTTTTTTVHKHDGSAIELSSASAASWPGFAGRVSTFTFCLFVPERTGNQLAPVCTRRWSKGGLQG